MFLKLENINLEFGEKVIFDKINFIFNRGDKIGIIGDNGSGKTSLLNIILKTQESSGTIILENNNVGFLAQDDSFEEVKLISKRKKEIETLLLQNEIIQDILKYSQLLEEYNSLLDENISSNQKDLMLGFNFNEKLFEKEKKEELSGGESTKFKLIKLFSQQYDYFLLDEPSNHLDLNAKKYLIENLKNLESFMLVSHDVELLNTTCNKILEIKNSSIKVYTGNYDNYIKEKNKEIREIEKIQTEYTTQKNKIQSNIDNLKSWSSNQLSKKTKHLKHGQVINDLGLGKGSADSGIRDTAKKIIKMREKMDSLETVEIQKDDNIKIKYLHFEKPNKEVLKIDNLKKFYDTFKLEIKEFLLLQNEKIAIQGKNGSGKSTLLKLISKEIQSDEGIMIIGDKVKVGYVSQKNETLNVNNTILQEVNNLGTHIEESELRLSLIHI